MLLAVGVSNSAVGAMDGQLAMRRVVGFKIPALARRVIAMIPAFVVVALGVNATQAAAAIATVLILTLNVVLVLQALGVPIPGLSEVTAYHEA